MSSKPVEKEYNGHTFERGVCICGCWKNPTGSSGPPGLDPDGECPKSPKDGHLIGGKVDYEIVAERRMAKLNHRIQKLVSEIKGKDDEIKRLREARHSKGVPELEL